MPAPVREYFAVTFRSQDEAVSFDHKALAVWTTATQQGNATGDRRVVVFGPLTVAKNAKAYVSRGAAAALRVLDPALQIAPEAIDLEDLPDGLAMVVGLTSDRNDYDERRA